MEIIKHGKEYYSKTCENCGCVFTFNRNEIKRNEQHYYDFREHTIKTSSAITCPECGEIIELSNDTLVIKEN